MAAFLSSPHIADLMIGFLIVELLVLAAYRRRTGKGPAIGSFIYTWASGLCLALALRLALDDGPWAAIVFFLTGALLVHIADLRRHWGSER